MNAEIVYPIILVVAGVVTSTAVFVILGMVLRRLSETFQLYPESTETLDMSLKILSLLVAAVVFLLFLRPALLAAGLDFTTGIVEDAVGVSSKYILAIATVLAGFYVSRIIKEASKEHEFKFKDRVLLVMDFVIHMTFLLTALLTVGIDISVFLELYKIMLWSAGAIATLIVGMVIAIPLGLSIYDKIRSESRRKRAR